ncbi:PAAR domain-containing protein, partial [Klebsiella pneumoniae]
KIGPDPRNFNQRVSLGRNDLLIRTFPNAIIEGSPEWSSDGKAIVVDGCKCQCGCQVISGAPECAIG